MQIEIKNKANNQKAIITRCLLSDGYNYYIMLLNKGCYNIWFANESYKQEQSIYSLREAELTAKSILSN